MSLLYTAVKRFDPACGESWTKYIAWSGLSHLREVISLDGILCPSMFRDLTAEDWQHNVQEDFKTSLFLDLEYVVRRVAEMESVNLLAIMQEPTADQLRQAVDPRLVFRGFDLLDRHGDISALLNCGGFPRAFAGSELSECGLLVDLDHAKRVQQLLRAEYPSEPHADCDLWAIWQLVR